MSVLIAQQVTQRYADQTVLSGVCLNLGRGAHVGLIGPNGAGKTTLLNVLAGAVRADEGDVHVVGRATLGYLTQTSGLHSTLTLYEELRSTFKPLLALERQMKRLEPQLSTGGGALLQRYDGLRYAFETGGGYSYDSRIHAVLKGLQFSTEQAQQPLDQLSGGQAARAALAKLLLQQPDVLLLDEPTNHLDLEALAWLEEYLQRWKGAYIISSHDRLLLDRLVDSIWALEQGRLDTFTGNYTAYVAQHEEALRHRWEAYYEQQATIRKSEDFIRRNHYDKKTAAQAQARRRALEKIEPVERPAKERELAFEIAFPRACGRRVLRLQGVDIGYPSANGERDDALFHVEHAVINRGQRVALIGPNGSGKTSLLKTLIGQIPPLAGKVEWGHAVAYAYFSQIGWDCERERTLVEVLSEEPGWTISKARSLLGQFLFSGEEAFKKLEQLSGGERSRVALAHLAQLGGNVLLLDEPTNHLDIPARETLERVLLAYPGTVLMVSHDRFFVQKLATHIWEIRDQALHVYAGDYRFYRRRQDDLVSEAVRPTVERKAAEETKGKLSPGKLLRLRQRQRAKLEREEADIASKIQELDQTLADVETGLEQAGYDQNLDKIQQLHGDYERLKHLQETLYTRWEQVAQQLEAV